MEEPKFEPVPEETAEAPAEPAALPAADEALIPEIPEEPAAPAEDPMVEVCDVQFRSGSKVYFFAPGELKIATGDEVILETARGPEFGQCVRGNHMVHPREVTPPLRPILRLATQQDKRVHAENCRREKRAMDVCQQKIADLGLEMQLVSAEYAFDGSKVLFFFTADGRVDFRELVKSLASVLRTRIELRPRHLRPPVLLPPVPGRFPAGVHQDGQDAEPQPESHENFRHLRPTDVLPELRAGDL